MSRSQQARLALWLTVSLVGGLIGYVYTALSYPLEGPQSAPPLRGMRAGLMIACATSGFEIFVMRSRFGRWIKSFPLGASLIFRTLIHTALIAVILQVNVRLVSLSAVDLSGEYLFSDLVRDTLFSLVAMAAILFVMQMRQLVGPRNFSLLMSGRYHKPRREERIFAIFDIVGSTAIAEQIGDEYFHAFVSQVFFDIDAPVVDRGGEVMSFVGDALIADWPMGPPAQNRRVIEAAFAVCDVLRARGDAYRQRFGLEPQIRVILHGGAVVAGEMGDSRRQIVYLGDVLNVASRIEAVAKTNGSKLTISGTLLGRTDLPQAVAAHEHGAYDLKGVREKIAICELSRAS
ncbi:adenylate/guanylate cyclase domain-containing protein [Tepidamorphus sp. 3E244]|uniref:adenylate/guanylate cyclase domain-containing protein n=1 Tax=Tepidamorphus sp. 3E244 TaxID=3385498 RepID=UPI0038FC5558